MFPSEVGGISASLAAFKPRAFALLPPSPLSLYGDGGEKREEMGREEGREERKEREYTCRHSTSIRLSVGA